MRILIVTPLLPPEPGGPSYYAVALKEALEKQGQNVSLKAFRDVRHLPTGIRHVAFLWQVFRLARHADVLIVLDTVSVALPAVLAATLARRPVVIRTGGDFVWERFVERTKEKVLLSDFYTKKRALSLRERLLVWVQKHIVFPHTTRLVFSTTWQRDIWETPYRLAVEKTHIIENSYPTRSVEPEDRETANTATSGPFVCAWRPTAFKNVDTLERALELALELTLEQGPIAIDFLRGVPRDELYAKLRRARALVVPSLSEVSPNLCMEALARGVPVLVTEDCGTKERFGNAVTYLNPTDPVDMRDKLVALMDPGTYAAAKERAAAFSYTHTYDDIAHEFLVLCKDL